MPPTSGHNFASRMLDTVNRTMLDMTAAIARKDYEQRHQRQVQGILKVQQEAPIKAVSRHSDATRKNYEGIVVVLRESWLLI